MSYKSRKYFTNTRKVDYENFRFPYLPHLLNPKDIKFILEQLNIDLTGIKVNQKGYVKISNPFKVDSNRSFCLNVNKGNFIDFDDPTLKGDIVKLVQYAKNYSLEKAEYWIAGFLNVETKGFKVYKYMLSKRLQIQIELENQTLNN